jgi:hypothetical protein
MELRVFWTDTARFQLENNPDSGPKEPLLYNRNFEYRYLAEGNYKIIYRKQDNYVTY